MDQLVFGCLAPIMVVQGLWVRLRVPKLPEAKGPRAGVSGMGSTLRILVIGDSSAAGVGAHLQDQALAGQLVSRLKDKFKVNWKLIAKTGWSTRELLHYLSAMSSATYDIALTATGVNDITSRKSIRFCLREQIKLVEKLREKFDVPHILMSGLPPVHRFPSLPEPLRSYIGGRAKQLDNAMSAWSSEQSDCDHIRLDFPVGPENMAPDGFHPGPKIYAHWAEAAANMIEKRWS